MKIAWFTPFSTRSAIGEYSERVVDALAEFGADVEIWSADRADQRETSLPVTDYGRRPELLSRLSKYDWVLYNIGNHLGFHEAIYEASRRHPGIVVLHDRVCHSLFAGYWLKRGEPELYLERMESFYGAEGRTAAHESLAGSGVPIWESDTEMLRFPLFEEALIGARGVIVHSSSHGEQVRSRWFGPVGTLFQPTPRIGPVEGPPAEGADGRLTLLTLGHVNPNKQVHRIVELLAHSPDLRSRYRYVVVGPYDERSSYWRELSGLVRTNGLADTVSILGYQPDDVVAELMAGAHVFANLRSPALEGASESLMRQLAYGRPVVVYDTGAFAELPEGAAVRVPVDDVHGLGDALGRLGESAELRDSIGSAAQAAVAERSSARFAVEFSAFLDEARPWQPTLAFADRVADELALMGTDARLSSVSRIAREIGTIIGVTRTETPEIVPVGTEHADSLGRFFVRNDVPEMTAGFDPFPLTAAEATRIAAEPREDRYYAALLDGEVVGLAMLRGWDEGYEVPSFGVMVDAGMHGLGIGARLTDYAIAEARALGSPRVRLSVYGRNHVAHRMYAARGFVEQSRESVQRPDGRDERIVMVKDLADPEAP